eukprot:TRINITY_DN10216_c0_g1_i2.p1 TRINITY_DN10216_c0_g1~~TRINITY_DN10216_c0_g1_i2.p1  ORF type:complete len:205 (+),score=38.78 TRINITY_DN10216_c0_g1_i2:167-781(+)
MKHNNHLNPLFKLNQIMRPKFTGEKALPIDFSTLPAKHRRNAHKTSKSFMDENRAPANGSEVCLNKPEDISEGIEEMGNCTRRMGRMVRVDSAKMIPSQIRRNALRPEEELEAELKKLLKDATQEERLMIASQAFNKAITINSKFSRVLRIIKRIYDESLEHESQKYKKLMSGIAKKSEGKSQVRIMPINTQNTTAIEETGTFQ